jgi:hypothetical protein
VHVISVCRLLDGCAVAADSNRVFARELVEEVAAADPDQREFRGGGECRDKQTYPEFEAYDPKTGRWTSLAPMTHGRHVSAAQ